MEQALYGGEDGCDVVGGAPAVLEDVEAQLPVGVHVWVEHGAQELDRRGLVRVRLVKCQHQPERAVLERRLGCERAKRADPRTMMDERK